MATTLQLHLWPPLTAQWGQFYSPSSNSNNPSLDTLMYESSRGVYSQGHHTNKAIPGFLFLLASFGFWIGVYCEQLAMMAQFLGDLCPHQGHPHPTQVRHASLWSQYWSHCVVSLSGFTVWSHYVV